MKAVLIALAVAGIVGYACGSLFGGDEIIYPPDVVTKEITATETVEVEQDISVHCKSALRLANAIFEDVQTLDTPYSELPQLMSRINKAMVYDDTVLLKEAQEDWNTLRNDMIPGLNQLAVDNHEFQEEVDQCLAS